MDTFDYKKYLTENKLIKEVTFADVKAAAKVKGEGDSFQIKTKFGVKQFDHFPSRKNPVALSTIGADDSRDTDFMGYDEALEMIKKLNESELVNEYASNTNTPFFQELVPRMEGIVDKEAYKKFVDSLDDLLDDWYMEGFDKGDVLNFLNAIIPSN